MRVDTVADPTVEHPTDAVIRGHLLGLCGSDLHLYEVLAPFLDAGDILGQSVAIDLAVARARRDGIEVFDLTETDDIVAAVREVADGHGPDAVIEAVGMEAHGSPAAKLAQTAAGLVPDPIARRVFTTAGTDRMEALDMAIELVQRGGTISISGVYGGAASPVNLMKLLDKEVKLRMGQANVKRWVDDIMPLLTGAGDPLGVEGFASHHVPLAEAPDAYKAFPDKADDTFKVVFKS